MNNKQRTMNSEQRTNAFTLVELVVAVALLTIVISFTGVIFNVSIDAHRAAGANAEIMQKLRAITDQFNADFKGLQKDGYLILYSQLINRQEFADSPIPVPSRADRLYYFTTGDFQSWFEPTVRSNIARVYLGADSISLFDPNEPVSRWNLARDVMLLTPGITSPPDCYDISYAQCKADLDSFEDVGSLLSIPVPIDIFDPCDVRRLMCQNAGQMIIEWTDGTKYDPDNSLVWWGMGNPIDAHDPNIAGIINENKGPPYTVKWTPRNRAYWPKALKFTFTLYDSKGILKQAQIKKGKTFTHIVYLGE